MNSKKLIAVTGSKGFIGQYIQSLLVKKGLRHKIFNRKKHELFKDKYLEDFFQNVDAVIHLAGVNRGTPVELIQGNTMFTTAILDGMRRYAPDARLVFSSSFQVYDLDNEYAVSKKASEDMISLYSKKYNISAVILRMSNVYGPYCKPFYNSVIATFAHQISCGKEIVINGDGLQKKDFIYVTDVVDACLRSVYYRSDKALEVFDICTGSRHTIREVVHGLKEHFANEISVTYNTDSPKERDQAKRSPRKANTKLSWKSTVSLDRGLKQIAQSYVSNYKKTRR